MGDASNNNGRCEGESQGKTRVPGGPPREPSSSDPNRVRGRAPEWAPQKECVKGRNEDGCQFLIKITQS